MQAAKNALTAAGAGTLLYQNQDRIAEIASSGLNTLSGKGSVGGSSSRDDALILLMTEMLKQGRNAGVTIVNSGSSSTSYLRVATGVIVAAGGGYVYYRIRGLSADDLFYVTKSGFKNGLCAVMSQMLRVKDFLGQRIDVLSGRVEEGLAVQEGIAADVTDMKHLLTELADGQGGLRSQLGGVEARLEDVAGRQELERRQLEAIADKQDFACRGIYLLCSVVSEAVSKDRHLDTGALRDFAQQPPSLFPSGPRKSSPGFADAGSLPPLPSARHSIGSGSSASASGRASPVDLTGGLAAFGAAQQQQRAAQQAAAAAGSMRASPSLSALSAAEQLLSEQQHQKVPLAGASAAAAAAAAQQQPQFGGSQASLESVLAAIQQMAHQHMAAPAAAGK